MQRIASLFFVYNFMLIYQDVLVVYILGVCSLNCVKILFFQEKGVNFDNYERKIRF